MSRLGDIELQRLTPANLSGFYRALLTDARRDGQGLAPKTVRNIHAMLHRALKDAVRLGYLVRNVADAIGPRGRGPRLASSASGGGQLHSGGVGAEAGQGSAIHGAGRCDGRGAPRAQGAAGRGAGSGWAGLAGLGLGIHSPGRCPDPS